MKTTSESVTTSLPFGGVGQIVAMLAEEGWYAISDDHVMWQNPPSSRVLTVWRLRREETRMGCWGPEPADPKTEGYSVTLRVHDDLGNPVAGEGFWVQDYDTALTLARKIRTAVLSRPSRGGQQLTLDDLVSGHAPLIACSDECARKLADGAKPIGADASERFQLAELARATRIGRAVSRSTE